MSKLLTTKELCQWLKISSTTANTWRRNGMPYNQVNQRVIRYDKQEIEKWLKENSKS